MEISFEKGKFVYCPGGFNYQEVLDDFKRAKKVRIITYNISGTGNTDPLLEQIKKLGEDVDVQIITNIPSRFETYYSSAAGEAMRSRAKHNIEVYLKKLNPESFPIAIYDSKKQDFEDVSDIFIRGIDSIIEVLKLVEELIDRYKDARISADIDNT